MYLWLLSLLFFMAWAAQAEPRMALLIGNGSGYRDLSDINVLGPLYEPEQDVDLLRQVLQTNGFTIPDEFVLKNASKQDMEEAVQRFAARVLASGAGTTVLFFYAGHGVQGADAHNYLIPVGGTFATNADVVYRGINAQWVLDTLAPADSPRTGVTIALLDACRNKMPLKTSARGSNMPSGFAQMSAAGVIIGYATAPNGIAYGEGPNGHGLYTKHLAAALNTYKHLPLPLVLEQAASEVQAAAQAIGYAQTPWYNSGLVGKERFCLAPPCRLDDGGESEELARLRRENELLQAQLAQQTPEPSPRKPFEPEMVQITGGTFMMGSPAGEGYDNERPQHEVTVGDFAIGKYEVTQGEWQAVMGNNPAHFSSCGERCPVEQVSWNDVQEYIAKLNAKTGKTYRLPTEAEWEYACRGGAVGETYCGGNDIDSVAWHYGNSGSKTHPVGQKAPNGFGLFDMSGNVWEWNQDRWHGSYAGAPTDGTAWESGDASGRLLRGCSWSLYPGFCRAAGRLDDPNPYNFLGFRVVFRVAGRAD